MSSHHPTLAGKSAGSLPEAFRWQRSVESNESRTISSPTPGMASIAPSMYRSPTFDVSQKMSQSS